MPTRARQKRIVAVDWDSHTLRVVHAFVGKRGVKIDRILCVAMPADLDPASPEQVGLHIQRTLSQEGISTRHAVVDIPRDQAILKTLKLPTAQPDELAGMVEIQIAKELPFPVAEAVIDFAAPTTDETGTTDVLVAAIRREQLEFYEATFAVAGLKLDRIGLRPYASKVAVCELLKHAIPERVLFIDVRSSFMEIDVLRNGALSFSRSASVTIPKGGVSSTPSLSIMGSTGEPVEDEEPSGGQGGPIAPDGVIHSLVLEVTRSIEAYRASDAGATIDHVVIGGDVGVEEALAEALEKRLEVTTELYNPASTFGWDPDEGAGAAAFAASLGLVLGHADEGTLHFDFLHPKKRVSVTQEKLKKAPLVAAVIVLFVAAVAVGFAGYTKSDRDEFARLGKSISRMEGKSRDNKKFLDLVGQVEKFDAEQHVWVDVLYDVFSVLPGNKEMVVSHLEMNQKDGRITLKTRTKTREVASGVIHRLREFYRDNKEDRRFEVSMGPQTEKKREKYPFAQDLRIMVLDDEATRKGSKKRSSGR